MLIKTELHFFHFINYFSCEEGDMPLFFVLGFEVISKDEFLNIFLFVNIPNLILTLKYDVS